MSEPKYTPTKGNEQTMVFQGGGNRPTNSTNGKQFQATPSPSNGTSGGKPKYT